MLRVTGLCKTFPSTRAGAAVTVALDHVDLVAPTGTFVSVLGPSGSGKTTLLRCIAGFERPEAGVITLDGRVLTSPQVFVPSHRRGVGVVPQEGALFPHLTVAQNIAFGLVGEHRAARRERVERLLEMTGIPGLGDRRPDQLSGGQQQRVALARALAPEPSLVLLDEPFSALDAQLRTSLREEVRELLRTLGTSVVLVTHDQSEALSLADHLLVMRAGRVIAAGEPEAVYDRPVDVDLGRFLGEALVLPGEIRQGTTGVLVQCALGTLPVGQWHGSAGQCQVLIRPEQLEVRTAVDATVTGTVRGRTYYGHDALLHVSVTGINGEIPVRVHGMSTHHVGDAVAIEVTAAVATFPESGRPAGAPDAAVG